jgi:hypothetical protein
MGAHVQCAVLAEQIPATRPSPDPPQSVAVTALALHQLPQRTQVLYGSHRSVGMEDHGPSDSTERLRLLRRGQRRPRTKAVPAARSGPRFGPPWFLLLAGYENLTAPLFALSLQCKAEVTVPAPGGSP